MLRKAFSFRPFSHLFVLFLCLIFSLITLLIYWKGLHGPFFLDDYENIYPTQIKNASWRQLFQISMQNMSGPLGRPISILSFALNNLFVFNSPSFYFKIVNLGVHILCGLVLGRVVYLLIRLLPNNQHLATKTALLTMFLWLIHPLQVSTVLYIVQRMTQLSALFTLMGINVYLCGRIRQLAHQKYWLILISISFLIFFPLSVLSKETGLLFPWYIFCVEYFILKFACPTQKQHFYLLHFNRILSLSLILCALSYFYIKLPTYFSLYQEKDWSLISRLLTESKILIFYLSLILKPSLSKMGLYHDDIAISTSLDGYVILSISLLFAICFCIFFYRRRQPVLAFGLAWFLISHSIESTLLPLELTFEHRNYLAIMGILLIPSYYFFVLVKTIHGYKKILIITLGAALLLLITLLTLFRVIGWSSYQRFIMETLTFHPNSIRAHVDIAHQHAIHKNYPLALYHLNQAQTLDPNNTGILLNKILVSCDYQDVSENDYALVKQKIKAGSISPYVLLTLKDIVQKILNNECPHVKKEKIEPIIQSAIQNPYLRYKPVYLSMLYQIESGIALMDNDPNKCRILLMKAYDAYPKNVSPLIQKATLEYEHGLFKEAQETRALIEKNARFFDKNDNEINKLDTLLHSKE